MMMFYYPNAGSFTALLLVSWTAAAQPCSTNDAALMTKLVEHEEFIEYICPTEKRDCGIDRIGQKIEIKAVQLSPAKSQMKEGEVCMIMPIKKGRQFPTLVFESSSASSKLIAEDWDSGLKVLPKICNGMYVLEGRAIPEPGVLEVYRLKWKQTSYSEYSRKCYRVPSSGGNAPDKLTPAPCS